MDGAHGHRHGRLPKRQQVKGRALINTKEPDAIRPDLDGIGILNTLSIEEGDKLREFGALGLKAVDRRVVVGMAERHAANHGLGFQ